MLLIPAIDLKDGQCVRLKQGDMKQVTTYSDNPAQMAAHWLAQGARRLHLVDLNGAFAGKAQLGGVMTLPQGNATYFCIGGDAAYSGDAAEYLLNGEVGLARMYSSALTAPQVKRLYVDLKK